MLRDDRPGLTCASHPYQHCPGASCPGRADPGVCRHIAARDSWRAKSPGAQVAAITGDDPDFRPRIDPADRRLRIGMLAPCCQVGGAETWQQQVARSVDPARVAWMGLVVAGGAIDPAVAEAYEGLMPVTRGRSAAARLAEACDVVISWAIEDIPGLLAGLPEGSRSRVISVAHAPIESEWGRYFYGRPEGIDRWVAVSELARDAIPTTSRAGRPVDVIWNAVDADRLLPGRTRAEVHASWGVPPGVPVAGFLQRLTIEKDPLAAVRLAARLPEPWRVVIVGNGHMAPELARLKAEWNLDRLVIAGPDLDAGGVLGAFDTLIVASEYESFGLTMGEGFWAGLPVISTRVGLVKIVPGLAREIPIAADGDTLAAAVLADAADPRGTKARVARARAFAHDRLASDRFGREWTDCLARSASTRPEVSPCRPTLQLA